MDAKRLKAKLKAGRENLNNQHAIRLHRAISWLKSAEDLKDNLDKTASESDEEKQN